MPTRVGLHAGPIALGHVGGSGHLAYHVVGDIVNTTARIERLNKHLGTRILASNEVASDLDALLLRPLGSFKLVGVSSPVSIVASELRSPNDE